MTASIKYLSADNLYEQINKLTSSMAVTRSSFEFHVEKCTLEDIEWNHMDAQHRVSIHHTYEKFVRIASGHNFSLSLIRWNKIPLFMTVTDVYIDKGVFYQSTSIAGLIFIHSIITMEEVGEDIKLKDEWFVASHKLLRFLHKPLNKKLFKLHARLQEEDEQIRQGRFYLRKKGFRFRSDPPDYCSSNTLTANTIYPALNSEAHFLLNDIGLESVIKKVDNLEFIVQKTEDNIYQIWPAACPHEGGPLNQGKICNSQIVCPWHSLRFSAARVSSESPRDTKYGFEYTLSSNTIAIRQVTTSVSSKREAVEGAI